MGSIPSGRSLLGKSARSAAMLSSFVVVADFADVDRVDFKSIPRVNTIRVKSGGLKLVIDIVGMEDNSGNH